MVFAAVIFVFRLLMQSYRRNWKIFLSFSLCVLFAGCFKPAEKSYVLMEKQMADIPSGSRGLQSANVRKRTTAKVVIATKAGSDTGDALHRGSDPIQRENIEKALRDALADIRHDDPELDAVLVWAYKNRSELNQTFTLGKLEWSKDKKGWEGKQNLSEEIIMEVVR